MIDRYLLRYFLAVVEEGNFSSAAKRCRVSQPTLSVGIAKLERLLGQALFIRSTRRVEMTEAGVRLVARARRIESAFADVEAGRGEGARRTVIRFGMLSSLPSAWIEASLRAVADADLAEQIEIVEGSQRELGASLDRGRIDVAIGVLSADPRGRDPFFSEAYGLALAASHPLAGREAIAPAEVATAPMLVRRHCEALADVSRYFTSHGVRPFMAARTLNDDRAVAYVRAGLGLTVLPRCFTTAQVSIVGLEGFALTRSIGFLVQPDSAQRLRGCSSLGIIETTMRDLHRAG